MLRRFAVIGQRATASSGFRLDDLPGTSGRLDVLARSVRAAFLVSHGLRSDVVLYLVLLGGPRAPRVVRIDGRAVRFLRPDERAIAVLLQKVLADDGTPVTFAEVKPGISVASGPIALVLQDAAPASLVLLRQNAPDMRSADGATFAAGRDVLFVLGDHLGIPAPLETQLLRSGATALGLGPVAVHTEDAIAIVHNELDRRVER